MDSMYYQKKRKDEQLEKEKQLYSFQKPVYKPSDPEYWTELRGEIDTPKRPSIFKKDEQYMSNYQKDEWRNHGFYISFVTMGIMGTVGIVIVFLLTLKIMGGL